jgi:hypothetical protein
MRDEHWGTFSIFDHRDPVFRRALVLFDRVVIPVPDRPMYDITEEELDSLSADVDYLVEHGAAVRYPWSSAAFQSWQTDVIREALSVTPRDNLFDSRLLLQQKAVDLKPADIGDVVAVPVYGARNGYDASLKAFAGSPEQLLTLELAQYLTVPDADVPLQALVDLRARPAFRSAMDALRRWEGRVLPEALSEKTDRHVRAAANDFANMLRRYEEAIAEAQFTKKKACVVSILALGAAASVALTGGAAIAVLSSAAPALFALKEADKPCWKKVRDTDFAPAGVIYEANEAFARYRHGA